MNTGPEAIENALKNIDLDALEAEQKAVLKKGSKTARPRAVRILNIIQGMRRNQTQPSDLVVRSVPVIPPKFRPFSVAGGSFIVGDANEHYRDIMEYRRLYEKTEKSLGRPATGPVYKDLVASVRASYGFGDSPNPKTLKRNVKGFFDQVSGTTPKTSFIQSKLLAKPVDAAGRAVAIPDADLGLDEVAIPHDIAWGCYGEHVQGRLVRGGMSPAGAFVHVRDRTDKAMHALKQEMSERPGVLTRSPAWHAHNVVGVYPKLTDGDSIKTNSYMAAGMNLDHDGDDQHNYVVFSMPKELFSTLQLNSLTPELPEDTVADMVTKHAIPILDPSTSSVAIVDLSDFPRGDSLGLRRTATAEVELFEAIPGTKVVAYDPELGTPRWADVSFVSKHVGPCVEIVDLGTGRQMYTDDDPRAVYGIDPGSGDFELRRYTPSDALAAGVVVPYVRRAGTLLAQLGVLTDVAITDAADCAFKSVPLSWDFGWFLGAMCGDGWWDKKDYNYTSQRADWLGKRGIHFSDLKGFNAAKLRDVMSSSLGVHAPYEHITEAFKASDPSRYGDTVKYTFNFLHSEILADWMTRQMCGERDETTSGSGNKHIPAFAFQAPEEFRRGLLCGLFDSDGTCAVSHGKDKPQLQCAFSSTSLRLCREVVLLCASMSINATVSFSKTTTAGNTSWIVTLSTTDCKRTNVFADLISPWKRDNFLTTDVDMGGSSGRMDGVVLPRHIADRVLQDLEAPKIRAHERLVDTEELRRKKWLQNISMQWYMGRREGVVSRGTWGKVLDDLVRRQEEGQAQLDAVKSVLRTGVEDGIVFNAALSKMFRDTTRFITPSHDTPARYKSGTMTCARLNNCLKVGRMGGKACRTLLRWLEETAPIQMAHQDPVVLSWKKMFVDNSDVCWTPVVGVQKTGQPETGYDLTVPGYETFMAADGVILSNTTTFHTYSDKDAVKDIKDKLMVSQQLWSIKNMDKVVPVPKHEDIVGLSSADWNGGGKHVFPDHESAMIAIRNGSVKMGDDVQVGTPL